VAAPALIPAITRARNSTWEASNGRNRSVLPPHKMPEAMAPAVENWVQRDLCHRSFRRMYARQVAKRKVDSPTTRPTRIKILGWETTESRTNATRILLSTETDNVSGKCAYVVRTCSAYRASLSLPDRTGRPFHHVTGRDQVSFLAAISRCAPFLAAGSTSATPIAVPSCRMPVGRSWRRWFEIALAGPSGRLSTLFDRAANIGEAMSRVHRMVPTVSRHTVMVGDPATVRPPPPQPVSESPAACPFIPSENHDSDDPCRLR
jgi:hypothetical protein